MSVSVAWADLPPFGWLNVFVYMHKAWGFWRGAGDEVAQRGLMCYMKWIQGVCQWPPNGACKVKRVSQDVRLLEHSGIGVDVLLSDLSLEAGDMVEINVTILIRMFCIYVSGYGKCIQMCQLKYSFLAKFSRQASTRTWMPLSHDCQKDEMIVVITL